MSQIYRSHVPRLVAAAVLVSASMFSLALWQNGAVGEDEPAKAVESVKEQARDLSKAFRIAAGKALPSVVTVNSKTKAHVPVGGRNRGENPFKGTPFEEFGKDFDFTPRGGQAQQGVGSGVIIDKSGIILTNNHVVHGADEVVVHLPDGREFKATDIKFDEQTDLAVIRIKGAGDLPAAKMGSSDALQIGDWVLAIGAPFALEQTVSQGIISGKGRELNTVGRANFLQTDAAINPGNSGGPLVNLDGEVVGINTAIATNSGTFSGIGFALPIDTAKWAMSQLIDKGSVQRAYLGVQIDTVTNDLAADFGVKAGEGVLVSDVLPNTPAAEAGLKSGDVIVSFAGQKVTGRRQLQEMIERVPISSKHRLEIVRNGHRETLEFVAKALPKQIAIEGRTPRRSTDDSDAKSYENSELGIEVTDLTDERAETVGYKGSGVMVANVDPASVAAEKGLRRGMIIKEVERKPVKSVDDFKTAVSKSSLKDGVLLLVRTESGQRYVKLHD